MTTSEIVPLDRILQHIIVLRGQRVIVARDLAKLYGVTTRRLNEQVKRNPERFPEDFAFQLTADERSEVVAKCDHLQDLKFSPQLPWAFTEHGAIQAANVLTSELAISMSVEVVRAFVRLRQLVVNHKAISAKLAELDARVGEHDEQLAAIIEAVRQLTEPVLPEKRRRIGFAAS